MGIKTHIVYLQPVVGQLAQTFIEYPPMQKSASFNLESVKEQMQKKIQARGRSELVLDIQGLLKPAKLIQRSRVPVSLKSHGR
jgi:hypothetical protein